MGNEAVEKNPGEMESQSQTVKAKTSGLAIAGFVCGLIGFILPFPFIFLGPVAIILSIIALVQINKNENVKGLGFGIAGLILGCISFLMIPILAAIAIPNFISMRIRAKEASVKSDMHVVQLCMEDWSTMADWRYPTSINDRTPTGTIFSELLPGNMANPFTNEPLNIRFMDVSEPFPSEYDEISIMPGDIYIFCDEIDYTILAGGRNGKSLELHLTSGY
ncbi:MAG: DUF4190 domain-containing protein [Candidatus Cloacimonadota bacterium]|nr:MAG: DUF4190 domain-containing protein [Candidatus Cloacimonadota bacterium]